MVETISTQPETPRDTVHFAVVCTKNRKVLAKIASEGVLLWCKAEKHWEVLTWERLESIRRELLTSGISDDSGDAAFPIDAA